MNTILICKSTWYYSPLDECFFFQWINQVKSISKYDGIGDELRLYFESSDIPEEDLRELLALFYRYKVNMKQLAIFLNDNNKKWFYLKTAYWFDQTFGE